MLSIIVYTVFQLLHFYVFSYQRTTLTIARKLNSSNNNEVQMILTPTWMGVLVWVSTIGFYGSVIYLWIQWGFLAGLVGLIFSHLLFAILPISSYFYKIVVGHLKKEIVKHKDNKEVKLVLIDLMMKVNLITQRCDVD